MKHHTKRILSLLLAACMMLGLLPALALTSWAEGETAGKDYDTAADGEQLYIVDFSGEDGMFTEDTGVNHNAVNGFAISEDGHRVTFSDKKAAGSYYVGWLYDYPIAGHVYTIDFYLESTNLSSIRCGSFMVHDGSRMSMNLSNKSNSTVTINFNGNTGRESSFKVDRKIDAENGNRQYFRYVVDGNRMCIDIFALDTNGEYSLLVTYLMAYLNTSFHNALYVGLHNWDVIGADAHAAIGDVTIYKGDLERDEYRDQYDAAENGEILYQADFREDNTAGFQWGSFRDNSGDYIPSEDGSSVTLATNDKSTEHRYNSWLPNRRVNSYGNYTYEFFITSNPSTGEGITKTNSRVSLSVLGFSGNNTVGFSFFDAASEFCYGGNFAAANNTTYKDWSVEAKVYEDIDPDTSDPSKSNVKIEFDTLAKTITCYVLDAETQTFVRAKSLSFSPSVRCTSDQTARILNPLVYVYAYNNYTNAMLKDFKVVKGLSVSGGDSAPLMELVIDGKTQPLQFVTADTRLPAITEKDYYTAVYQLADGTVVTDASDLELTPGYNRVELTTVYTPEPIAGDAQVELRGIQSLAEPTGETTAVRLIGIVNTLDLEAVGFEILAIYRDADGTVHEASDFVAVSTDTVYNSVLADGGNVTMTAEELGGKYVYAVAINNVPVGENVQVDFFVMPYSVAAGLEDIEDNRNYGQDQTISFVNGKYDVSAQPLE